MADLILVRRMKRFRNVLILVVATYGVISAVLTFVDYRWLNIPLHGGWAVARALAQTTAIFALIAVIGLVVSILSSVWRFFTEKRGRLF